MDRGQSLSEGVIFLASIVVSAVVAFGITALVDPPLRGAAEPPLGSLEGLAISLAIALGLALIGSIVIRAWPSSDRGQAAVTPIPVGLAVAAIVGILVGAEILERQREATPPGADLGAPIPLEPILVVLGLLVVLGGVIVLRRRAGA